MRIGVAGLCEITRDSSHDILIAHEECKAYKGRFFI